MQFIYETTLIPYEEEWLTMGPFFWSILSKGFVLCEKRVDIWALLVRKAMNSYCYKMPLNNVLTERFAFNGLSESCRSRQCQR